MTEHHRFGIRSSGMWRLSRPARPAYWPAPPSQDASPPHLPIPADRGHIHLMPHVPFRAVPRRSSRHSTRASAREPRSSAVARPCPYSTSDLIPAHEVQPAGVQAAGRLVGCEAAVHQRQPGLCRRSSSVQVTIVFRSLRATTVAKRSSGTSSRILTGPPCSQPARSTAYRPARPWPGWRSSARAGRAGSARRNVVARAVDLARCARYRRRGSPKNRSAPRRNGDRDGGAGFRG